MLNIESNIEELRRDLKWYQRDQIPFAVSLALNEVGKDLIETNKAHMQAVFDRPTRWTLNAFHFRRASKTRQFITIERKLPARGRHYLEVQDKGGKRQLGGWERQIAQRAPYGGTVGYIAGPKVKRDGHGNISRGVMQRILSDIRAQGDPANNATAASRKRRGMGGLGGYFIPREGGKLKPGVYQRRARGKVSRVLAFNSKAPAYKARLRFEETMRRRATAILPGQLERAMQHALATARK